MTQVQDTELKKGHYPAGALVDNGTYRVETDSLGEVLVPADRLWGAQTQRSLIHFSIGNDHMPKAVYHAYGYVKKAAALVNAEAGKLSQEKANLIERVCDEVIAGKLDSEFPLYVWQTGSGTQSNMNPNEGISNPPLPLAGGKLGTKTPIHPNDDVNMSQSSNDTFPTAMHIATVMEFVDHLIPRVEALIQAMWDKAVAWVDLVKIGRTHLEDATPLTVGQEWSGYVTQLRDALDLVKASMSGLYKLAAGRTAVGTGVHTLPDFGPEIADVRATLTGQPFVTAPNKFAAQGSLDAMANARAALRALAAALRKSANSLARA